MKKAIIGATAALLCLHASAEFFSGNRLLTLMRGDNFDQIHAMGYVAGASDAINGVLVCPPPSFTLGQAYDMTKQLLEALPAERHASADIFVRAVLVREFPCKQQQQQRPGRGA